MSDSFDRLSGIYEALCSAAMCSPWEREPYAVIRRGTRSGGVSNAVPNSHAFRLVRWLDNQMNGLAIEAAEKAGLQLQTDFLPSGYKRLLTVNERIKGGAYRRWLETEMRWLARMAEERSDEL